MQNATSSSTLDPSKAAKHTTTGLHGYDKKYENWKFNKMNDDESV